MDRPEHHSTGPLKERVEKGSGRHSTLRGRERSVFNQANTGTVSLGNLWETVESAYGPFRALQCHFELKLKLKPSNILVYLRNGSARIIVRAASLR